jgi:hypothetical protein
MASTFQPNLVDDVFSTTEAQQDRLLEAAFPELDDTRLLPDDRFQERIAYVCQKMQVPSLRAE